MLDQKPCRSCKDESGTTMKTDIRVDPLGCNLRIDHSRIRSLGGNLYPTCGLISMTAIDISNTHLHWVVSCKLDLCTLTEVFRAILQFWISRRIVDLTSWFNPGILRMETRLSKNSLDMTSAKNKSPPFFMQISVNYAKKKSNDLRCAKMKENWGAYAQCQ